MEDWKDLGNITEALKVQICHCMINLIEKRKVSKATKKDFTNSEMALEIVSVSQQHIRLVCFMLFQAKLTENKDIPMKTFKNENNKRILSNICKLYGLIVLQENKLQSLY